MPVLDKDEHRRLIRELRGRISVLMDCFDGRELSSNREGVSGRGHWVEPDTKCATKGSDSELRMAVDDFKNILSEIKRLK
jgi:hypothetical protein